MVVFEGACTLLDVEGEWCFDKPTKTLRVLLDGCQDPNTVTFRSKRLDYLFTATLPGKHGNPSRIALTLSNIVLWGATFAAKQSTVTLDRTLLAHPSANSYVLGRSGADAAAAETTLDNSVKGAGDTLTTSATTVSGGGSFTATNSTFEWSQVRRETFNYIVVCDVWCAMCAMCALCALCAMCTVYCVLCTVYCVLCTVYCC